MTVDLLRSKFKVRRSKESVRMLEKPYHESRDGYMLAFDWRILSIVRDLRSHVQRTRSHYGFSGLRSKPCLWTRKTLG